jgi:hypothetical protein
MKGPLALALVCLAVAASGCDAVSGYLSIPTRPTTFNAFSDDSGTLAGGDVHWLQCCTTTVTVQVTCLRAVGNRATIGTSWPTSPPTGRFWYVQEVPGEDNDRLDEDGADAPPTVCPDPPATITDNESVSGDIHVIDDFHP